MGYYEDLLAGKKRRTESLLTERPGQIEGQIGSTRDYMGGNDAMARAGATDLVSGISSQYGIDPSVIQAGNEEILRKQGIAKSNRESVLSFQRMKNLTAAYQKNYAYALDQYKAAGYNLQQSETFARAWAQQQQGQEFAAGQAENSRTVATQKDEISSRYGDLISNTKVDEGNPYEDAMIRSLVGLAPYAIYAGLKAPKSSPGSGKTFTNPSSTMALPDTLNWRKF